VVVGYRSDTDHLVLRSGTTRRQVVSAAGFHRSWRGAEFWGMVVLRPGELPARVRSESYLEAVADLEAAGQYQAARIAYSAATRRWPKNPTAWLGLGNSDYLSGNIRDAESNYRQAIQVAPGYAAAYNNLAEALADRGCFDAALAELQHAMPLAGDMRLQAALDTTRREILTRRPLHYPGDPPGCPTSLPPGAAAALPIAPELAPD
jgi:tetratricopeptide (TPR) repeat protein